MCWVDPITGSADKRAMALNPLAMKQQSPPVQTEGDAQSEKEATQETTGIQATSQQLDIKRTARGTHMPVVVVTALQRAKLPHW